MKENFVFLSDIYLLGIIASLGAWITWADLKTQQIPILALILLSGTVGLWAVFKGDYLFHLLTGIFAFIACFSLIFFFLKKHNILVLGGGDLKLITLFSFLLGFQKLASFFILSGLFGGLAFCINRNRKCPFAPFLFISFFMSEFLNVEF